MSACLKLGAMSQKLHVPGVRKRGTEGARGDRSSKEQEERGSSSQTSGSVASSVPTSPAFGQASHTLMPCFAQLKMEIT